MTDLGKDSGFKTPEADLRLADELERLCCAETEGEFFDRVTDNIGNILKALRASKASE